MAEPEISRSKRGGRWSLRGMTALVTGGTRGIGFVFITLSSSSQRTFSFIIVRFTLFLSDKFTCFKLCFRHAIVSDLAAFGAVVHTCSRTQTDLDKCLEEWQSEGFKVTGSVCDVSSPPQRENLIQEVASTFNGKLNIYVSLFFS